MDVLAPVREMQEYEMAQVKTGFLETVKPEGSKLT
jgi:hypothetical protein